MNRIFRRKLYDRLLQWKNTRKGKTAILVEGARRVGKSTLVKEFAQKEYESYILIDFNKASKRVVSLFDDLMDLDFIFLQLQAIYNVSLVARKSAIIFDEVQACPKARQAIKYLVEDGRYDYIETGSLISITKLRRALPFLVKRKESPCTRWITKNFVGRWEIRHQFLCSSNSLING